MDRLDAFERMLADIQDQAAREAEQMDIFSLGKGA